MPPSEQRGFSLIEMLVVMLIISIMITFAFIAFGDFGAKRRIKVAAEQLMEYIQFVEHEAIIETSTFGLWFSDKGYRAVKYSPDKGWQPLEKLRVFHEQYFPGNTHFSIQSTVSGKGPQIIISSSGEISPFIIVFSEPANLQLTGSREGKLSLTFIKEKS